jgi:hypothetical protein
MNSSQLIASPHEAIELLHDAYRHRQTCQKFKKKLASKKLASKKLASKKVRLARIAAETAEKNLCEAEHYAERIVGLIQKRGFQLERRDSVEPGIFVLIHGCEHPLSFPFSHFECSLLPTTDTHTVIVAGHTTVSVVLD